jgi:hypothetical protein
MSHSDLHQKKKQKNFVILAAIFGWVALIWVITMVKMTHVG